MTFRFNHSLTSTVLRRLSGVMLVAAILACIFVVVEARHEARERQAELLEKVGVAMGGPLSESVWMVDTPLLERQLKAMTEIPSIAHVAVTTFIGQEFKADKTGYQGGDDLMVRRVQLRHQNEPLGQLEIWGDSDPLKHEMGRVAETCFVIIALLVAICVRIYVVVSRDVSRPLNLMAAHLEKGSPQEATATALMDELPVGMARELASVASAIDRAEQASRGQSSQK